MNEERSPRSRSDQRRVMQECARTARVILIESKEQAKVSLRNLQNQAEIIASKKEGS